MGNIEIAKETLRIIREGEYRLAGQTIVLPKKDYEEVRVYAPKTGEALLAGDISKVFGGKFCRITVVNEDSYQAARRLSKPLVMNFANAHNAGGGFLLGATAQEEALCRCSTLYASIKSRKAAEMYRYNNTHLSSVESDYMLVSPNVCVFRNERCELLQTPFETAVITIPAPNRFGAAAFASAKTVAETMKRRIRIMLRIAAENGYRNLVLGAWGCGAFGNKPEEVSQYFKTALLKEEYGRCFEEVCFAIYGKTDGKNIRAFRACFHDVLEE
ncbi:MAG: TIGR02452 family protein [Lachnospiraceae bacterium]|jgi:uncharacterized protein (TIGR02452 family)|nr:TIGR02452 family protein [Lachnospiraceae bacterium]